MEFRRRIIHSVLVLLALSCCLCEARWINNDTRSNWDINSNVTLSLNQPRNGSTVTGNHRGKQSVKTLHTTAAPEEDEVLQIIVNGAENRTVVNVRIPNANYNRIILVERNEVVKLNFTREMLYSLNDLASTFNTPTSEPKGDMIMSMNHNQNTQLEQYKSATIGLTVICAVMFLTLTFLTLKYRAKNTSKRPEDTPLAVVKQSVESEYQSIRGLPRRETGNSYCYETVKPRLPPSRPSINNLLQSSEDEYENLKSCDLKTHVRESNPYVPMDEALAESGLTGSAVVLSGEDEDLYLTMKRLIRTEDTTVEPKDLGII